MTEAEVVDANVERQNAVNRAERAEARLAEAEPFLGFVQAMRAAMVRHSEKTGDPMNPWDVWKGPILRKALLREFDEWEESVRGIGDESKELVDVANTAFFIWRFLSRGPAGRDSGDSMDRVEGGNRPGDGSANPGVERHAVSMCDYFGWTGRRCPLCGDDRDAEARLAKAQVLLLQRLNAEYDAWTPIQRRDWIFATGAFLSRSPPEARA